MTSFKVLTFNIRGTHEDGINAWENRADLNVATIKKYMPDLIGFQEVQAGNETTYAQALTTYTSEPGPIFIRQTERYHRLPIYWNSSKFEKVSSGSFYLSETPDEWSISWNASLVRGAHWVRLATISSRTELILLNTHLDHEHEEARLNSAKLIIERLNNLSDGVSSQIIVGDFNALPNGSVHEMFVEAGFKDTFDISDLSAQNTFHGFKGDGFLAKDVRLDWILVRSGTSAIITRDTQIIKDAEPPLYPSDHYPVMTEIELVQ